MDTVRDNDEQPGFNGKMCHCQRNTVTINIILSLKVQYDVNV